MMHGQQNIKPKYIFLLANISMNVEAEVLLWNTESCIAHFSSLENH
jgi:hypothetical protein